MSVRNLRWLAALGGMTALSGGALYAAPQPLHETSYAFRGGVVIVPASGQFRAEDAVCAPIQIAGFSCPTAGA